MLLALVDERIDAVEAITATLNNYATLSELTTATNSLQSLINTKASTEDVAAVQRFNSICR